MSRFLLPLWLALHSSAFGVIYPLANPAIDKNDVIAFGGSYSPPTWEHLRLVATIMTKYGFTRGVIIPTWPYKPGAVPGEISLELTQIGVQNFHEVLEGALPYSDATTDHPGHFAWSDADGVRHELVVDDIEVRTRAKQDTASTFDYLHREWLKSKGRLFWFSGADSVLSTPSWTENWEEKLFGRANWLVLNRPKDAHSRYIEFEPPGDGSPYHPLMGTPLADFIDQGGFDYSTANEGRVHRFTRKRSPGIFIVEDPTLDISSSLVRKSLVAFDAPLGRPIYLTPSVANAAIFRGYFTESGKLTHYALEAMGEVAAQWFSDFRSSTVPVISTKNLDETIDWIVTHASQLGDPKQHPRERESELSPLPVVEWSAEALGVTDSNGFRALTEYRSRLLRARAERILGRIRSSRGLAIGGDAVSVNLVSSDLPATVPLADRRAQDKRNYWYDLNVSVNELAACLDDSQLETNLRLAAGNRPEVLALLLNAAIRKSPDASMRLDVFLGHRYISRLYLGDLRPELIAELSEFEQNFVEKVKAESAEFLTALGPQPRLRQLLGEMIGDYYAVTHAAVGHPNEAKLWQVVATQVAKRYPNGTIDWESAGEAKWMMIRVTALVELLNRFSPDSFKFDTSVALRGERLFRIRKGRLVWIHPKLKEARRIYGKDVLNPDVALWTRALGLATQYLEKFEPLLRPSSIVSSRFQILSTRTSDETPGINLLWDIHRRRAQALIEYQKICDRMPRALEYLLATHGRHADAENDMRGLQTEWKERWPRILKQISDLEYRWLTAKFALPTADGSEADHPQVGKYCDEWRALEVRLDRELQNGLKLNAFAMRLDERDVSSAEAFTQARRELLSCPVELNAAAARTRRGRPAAPRN